MLAAMARFGERLRDSLRAFRSVYGNKGLRRLQLAWAGAIIGGWAYVISLAVFAYREHGAYAVGALAVARWVTAGMAAPLAGIAGDRYPRVRVLVASNIVRCAAIAGAGVAVLADVSPFVVYALAVLAALAGTVFGPSESALIPTLARSPEELTAANVSASTIDSVGTFMGPALGGFLLAATSPEIAFFAAAGLVAWSAVVVSGVKEGPRAPRAEDEGALSGGLAGFRTLLGDPRLRLIAGLLAAYTLLDGALDVLIVVLALETLDLGDSGVGFLNSTAGVGGLLGIVVAAGLVGRKGLASPIGMGMAFWGLPILLIGLWPSQASALVLLAAVGAATTIVGVAGDTLMQRAVPEEVLARVFGVLDSMMLVSIAIGAALAPTFVDLIGMRGTLIGVGAILPVLALVSWPRLREIDRAAEVPAPARAAARASDLRAAPAAPARAARAAPLRAPRRGRRSDRPAGRARRRLLPRRGRPRPRHRRRRARGRARAGGGLRRDRAAAGRAPDGNRRGAGGDDALRARADRVPERARRPCGERGGGGGGRRAAARGLPPGDRLTEEGV